MSDIVQRNRDGHAHVGHYLRSRQALCFDYIRKDVVSEI